MSKSNLIKGTMVLTIAGLLTRVIGFFYRIYLSKAMGPEMMGIYQLIFPIFGISFTIFASGIQTAISKLVASELGNKHYKNIPRILAIGLFMSVGSAFLLSIFVFKNSDWIAVRILKEASCAPSIKLLSYVFPFCGITACINGYYYGLKKAGVPAATQLLEQIVRVVVVYFMATTLGKGDMRVTSELAVLGLVIGEVASQIYNVVSLFCTKSTKELSKLKKIDQNRPQRKRIIFKDLMHMTVPLTGNRLLISILHSVEAILIPTMLKKYGLSNTEALSIYGVLTGMSVPFIMFPTAITNSLAVLLLPTISEAQATKNDSLIKKTTAISIKYSLQIGILSAGIFIAFGNELGLTIFHNKLAGSLLATIAWLCPFLYITTTLGSIINGLGLAHLTFVNNVVGMSIRIAMILYFVPAQGIMGYLFSFLVSQLIITAMDGLVIMKHIRPPFEVNDLILKPGIIIAFSSYCFYQLYQYISPKMGGLVMILGFCFVLSVVYIILLGITKAVSLKDFK